MGMTLTCTRTLIARPYLRVSKDRSGRQRSVTEQLADAQRLAEAEGWTLGAPYAEPDAVSASRYGRKVRKGYTALVTDLERGRFDADVLVLWESSRGSRRMSEWSRLLELLADDGVRVHVTSHNRTYDLTNPRDVRTLHEDGTDAEYESGKTSVRVKRAKAANAAAGRPLGMTPYGFTRTYDPKTRALVSQDPHPDEAPVVRELITRLHKGHALRSITADFEQRGIVNRSGKPFLAPQLRYMALNPAYAGYVEHDGERYDAVWQPLVPRRVWLSVERTLRDPGRAGFRRVPTDHMLSGIAVCHVCDGPLRSQRHRDVYQCHGHGHVVVDEHELDGFVDKVMLAYLGRDDVYEALRRDEGDGGAELARVRDEISEYRGRLDGLADDLAIDEATLARRAAALRAKVNELAARERELSTPSALSGLITPGRDVRRRWKALPTPARREVARVLLTPGLLGQVRVDRGVRGHRVPVEQRIVWRRVDGDVRADQ